jgi:hypothetical protein
VKAKEPAVKYVGKPGKREERTAKTTREEELSYSRANSLVSTNESVNTTIASFSEKCVSLREKKCVIEKIKALQSKIEQKSITTEAIE